MLRECRSGGSAPKKNAARGSGGTRRAAAVCVRGHCPVGPNRLRCGMKIDVPCRSSAGYTYYAPGFTWPVSGPSRVEIRERPPDDRDTHRHTRPHARPHCFSSSCNRRRAVRRPFNLLMPRNGTSHPLSPSRVGWPPHGTVRETSHIPPSRVSPSPPHTAPSHFLYVCMCDSARCGQCLRHHATPTARQNVSPQLAGAQSRGRNRQKKKRKVDPRCVVRRREHPRPQRTPHLHTDLLPLATAPARMR